MISRMILVFVAGMLATVPARGAAVWGYCYLEGQANHGLTVVEIDGSALHPPDITDSDGYYGWAVVAALQYHTFTYSHPGYESETHVFWVPLFGGRLPDVTLESKAICDPADWDHYPYTIPDTDFPFTFPGVEGVHDPTSSYPVEWWYVNFRLTVTDEPDREYGGFVAFFKPPGDDYPGMVLQSIIDLKDGTPYYSHDEFPLIFLANDQWLDVVAGGNRLQNRQCGGDLLPFDYHLYAGWIEGGVVWIDLDMKCLKPPIAVGGDGYLVYGDAGWTYYYSHPRLEVQGTLHLPGFPAAGKQVQGYAWIDHQWASWPSRDVTWEWISIQLDDDREIMVADVWVDGEPLDSFSGGLNYYDEDCSLDILQGYQMTSLDSYFDPVTQKEFATQWRVTESSRQIDIMVTADFDHQVMHVDSNPVFQTCFWEGACTVYGTIDGQPVAGTAYAEVTHEFEPECIGDIDGDGDTDLADLATLLACYGSCDGDPEYNPAADFDGNDCIDLSDLAMLLSDYGCPP